MSGMKILRVGWMLEANGNHLHTNWILAVLELQLLFREVHEVGVG